MIILKIMVKTIMPMPKATVITNTVFNRPINGKVVIACPGRIHAASIISSNPKILPKKKPKIVEKNPQQLTMAARLIFFVRYKSHPPISRQSPCPTSPNIKPKRKE